MPDLKELLAKNKIPKAAKTSAANIVQPTLLIPPGGPPGPSISFEDPPNENSGQTLGHYEKLLGNPMFNVPSGGSFVADLDSVLGLNPRLAKRGVAKSVAGTPVADSDTAEWERKIRAWVGRNSNWISTIQEYFQKHCFPGPARLPDNGWTRALESIRSSFFSEGNRRLQRGITWALSTGKNWSAGSMARFLLTIEFYRALSEEY